VSVGNWENGEIMFASFDFDDFWLFGIFLAMGLRSCESGEAWEVWAGFRVSGVVWDVLRFCVFMVLYRL